MTQSTLLVLLILVSAPMVAQWTQGYTEHLVRQLIYFATSVVLLYQVWRGNVWAWRLTVALAILAGLLILVVGMLTHWAFFIVGLLFMTCGFLLVGHPSIRGFLDETWEARQKSSAQAKPTAKQKDRA